MKINVVFQDFHLRGNKQLHIYYCLMQNLIFYLAQRCDREYEIFQKDQIFVNYFLILTKIRY